MRQWSVFSNIVRGKEDELFPVGSKSISGCRTHDPFLKFSASYQLCSNKYKRQSKAK